MIKIIEGIIFFLVLDRVFMEIKFNEFFEEYRLNIFFNVIEGWVDMIEDE